MLLEMRWFSTVEELLESDGSLRSVRLMGPGSKCPSRNTDVTLPCFYLSSGLFGTRLMAKSSFLPIFSNHLPCKFLSKLSGTTSIQPSSSLSDVLVCVDNTLIPQILPHLPCARCSIKLFQQFQSYYYFM